MKYLVLVFSVFLNTNTFSQINKFDSLSNVIFFKINSHEADSVTYNFLKKNVHFLANKSNNESSWSAYPPNENDSSKIFIVNHSIEFTKHPYFNLNENGCVLHIPTKEINNKLSSHLTLFVHYIFNNKIDALKAFDSINRVFKPISKKHKIVKTKNKMISIFNKEKGNFSSIIDIVLTQDYFYENKYRLIISPIVDSDFHNMYK